MSDTGVYQAASRKLQSFGSSVLMPTYEDAIQRTLQGSYAFIGDYVGKDCRRGRREEDQGYKRKRQRRSDRKERGKEKEEKEEKEQWDENRGRSEGREKMKKKWKK